ncbi:hypothetical protein CD175_06420 [Pseudomonas laurylsulfatiphila]|jgi:hypothetical protein|uniref:Uncharacterized protein n=1 Tax=Pseudomonas laurylsulfatiphila TaxID=2011015 RepID=A0A2S6FNV8_9PSED|nr:hypothetical protein [Pseudomonas laurylsulfatiphila]PPK39128.1 hypothetical protein CD175_06420 [Pseudomonas laurylsulfatiphila]
MPAWTAQAILSDPGYAQLTRQSLQFSDSAEHPFKALFMLSKSKTVGHPAMLFLRLIQLIPLTGRAVYRTARS